MAPRRLRAHLQRIGQGRARPGSTAQRDGGRRGSGHRPGAGAHAPRRRARRTPGPAGVPAPPARGRRRSCPPARRSRRSGGSGRPGSPGARGLLGLRAPLEADRLLEPPGEGPGEAEGGLDRDRPVEDLPGLAEIEGRAPGPPIAPRWSPCSTRVRPRVPRAARRFPGRLPDSASRSACSPHESPRRTPRDSRARSRATREVPPPGRIPTAPLDPARSPSAATLRRRRSIAAPLSPTPRWIWPSRWSVSDRSSGSPAASATATARRPKSRARE